MTSSPAASATAHETSRLATRVPNAAGVKVRSIVHVLPSLSPTFVGPVVQVPPVTANSALSTATLATAVVKKSGTDTGLPDCVAIMWTVIVSVCTGDVVCTGSDGKFIAPPPEVGAPESPELTMMGESPAHAGGAMQIRSALSVVAQCRINIVPPDGLRAHSRLRRSRRQQQDSPRAQEGAPPQRRCVRPVLNGKTPRGVPGRSKGRDQR